MKHLLLTLGLALPLLTACGSTQSRLVENDEYGDWRANGTVRQRPLGSSSGITVFSTNKDRDDGNGTGGTAGNGTGVNVNAYLWRAALDTLSFMPIASADPFGGTI